ncbi:unnamed protein product, partial [Effrenium voratum]
TKARRVSRRCDNLFPRAPTPRSTSTRMAGMRPTSCISCPVVRMRPGTSSTFPRIARRGPRLWRTFCTCFSLTRSS